MIEKQTNPSIYATPTNVSHVNTTQFQAINNSFRTDKDPIASTNIEIPEGGRAYGARYAGSPTTHAN